MKILIAAILASTLFWLGFRDCVAAAHSRHRPTAAKVSDIARSANRPEPRREIHIIENANLKHVFKVNRVTGEVSECDYNPQNGSRTCAVKGYDARPGKSGNYILQSADLATAVYRIDLKTEAKTICAVSNGRVFCLVAIN